MLVLVVIKPTIAIIITYNNILLISKLCHALPIKKHNDVVGNARLRSWVMAAIVDSGRSRGQGPGHRGQRSQSSCGQRVLYNDCNCEQWAIQVDEGGRT